MAALTPPELKSWQFAAAENQAHVGVLGWIGGEQRINSNKVNEQNTMLVNKGHEGFQLGHPLYPIVLLGC